MKYNAREAKRLLLGLYCKDCYYYRLNSNKERCVVKGFLLRKPQRLPKKRYCAFYYKYEDTGPLI